MWKLGLDFGSSFFRPSMKTPAFQLLKARLPAWEFGVGAQDAGGRIAVTANTNEDPNKILLARYGDANRNIQAYLDFVERLPPATCATPDELNTTFSECHRCIRALRVLGDVNGYGRVLVPNILRAFHQEFCQRWIVHVKQGLSESF